MEGERLGWHVRLEFVIIRLKMQMTAERKKVLLEKKKRKKICFASCLHDVLVG